MFLGGSIIIFLLAVVKPGDDKSIFSVKIELLSLFGFDGVRTRCIGVASLESSALSGLPLPLRDPLTISPARILASEKSLEIAMRILERVQPFCTSFKY